MDSSQQPVQKERPRSTMASSPYPWPYYPHGPHENEVTVIEIWNILVKFRSITLGITVFTTVAAIAYAFLASPVYRAESRLLPPEYKDILPLVIENHPPVTEQGVYTAFKRNLDSRSLRLRFLNEQGLIDVLMPNRNTNVPMERYVEEISKRIVITPSRENSALLSLAYEWGTPNVAAQFVKHTY